MANRYWVGGTASWDGTAGTKWSTTSGGAGGASVPTTADDVFFDANSTGTCTISTIDVSAKSINCTGFAGTITGNKNITVAGSITLVTAMAYTHTGTVTFTGTGTLTTAGKTFGAVTINGAGITLTLGDALNTDTRTLTVTSGTFDTANYSVSAGGFSSSNSNLRTINLGSSTVTLASSLNLNTTTNLTFNAGTSQINLNSSSFSLSSGGVTFYNVSFTSNSTGTRTVFGINIFNNLTVNASALGLSFLSLNADQTVNGTLTCVGSTPLARCSVISSVPGTQRTIAAATVIADDCDFRDIAITGASAPIAPVRAGDCGGNSGIIFPTAKTVYRVGTNSLWTGSSSWALSSGGVGSDDNYPLPQDTAVIDDNTPFTGTLSTPSLVNIGTLDASTRTTNITLGYGFGANNYGSYTLGVGVFTSGTAILTFSGVGTQVFNSAGSTITFRVTVFKPSGVFRLGSALTASNSFTLSRGDIDLDGYTLTTTAFISTTTNTRSIGFGSGNITVNGAGITVWNTTIATGLTITGAPTVNVSYFGLSSTTVAPGTPLEANSIDFNITAGGYTLALTGNVRSLNFTGFSGTLALAERTIFGNLTLSSTMSFVAGSSTTTFASTSATPRNITTNGELLDFPIVFNGAGGSWVLQDAMTVGSTQATTLTTGTLDLNGKTLTTGIFNSSGSTTRSIAFGTGNITVNGAGGTLFNTSTVTGLTTSGTQVVNVSYSGSAATTVTPGSLNEVNSISFNFTTGLYTLGWAGSYRNVNFTGFSGTASSTSPRTIYGDLTLSSTMSYSSGTQALSFAATSGTKNITTNGVSIGQPISFDGVGGTWQLQDALTLVVGFGRGITSSAGTFNTNGYAVSADFLALGFTSSPRTINLGTSTVTLTGTSIPLNLRNSIIWQYLTLSASSSTINFTNAGTKTALVADKTWGTLNQAGAGALTIDRGGATGTPTIGNLTNTVQPTSVLFVAGNTYNFLDFSLSGTAGNLVTISSTTAAQHTLSKASGTINVSYCNISYSNATGGATWNAFTSNGNVDGGNNTGWLFMGGAVQNSNFLLFFNGP